MTIRPRVWWAPAHYRIARTLRGWRRAHAKRVLFGTANIRAVGYGPDGVLSGFALADGTLYAVQDGAVAANLHFVG